MKAISEKLRKLALKKTDALVLQLHSEGASPKEIAGVIKSHIDTKIRAYYRKQRDPKRLNISLQTAVSHLAGEAGKADSKAELIFYNMLLENDINFKFQYGIGVYRVDYLVDDDVVLELDGPLHNKTWDERRDRYIRKLGYRILRIPIWLVANEPGAVISEIKAATAS